ncbi:MAG: hypothetical protein L0Y60_02080 [Beijerinckiaceae bacterium]|nr:hypothetical protein [Beijerinckiaceae bacterium]
MTDRTLEWESPIRGLVRQGFAWTVAVCDESSALKQLVEGNDLRLPHDSTECLE